MDWRSPYVPIVISALIAVAVSIGVSVAEYQYERNVVSPSKGVCKKAGLVYKNVSGMHVCVDERGRLYDREILHEKGYVREPGIK